MAEGTSTARILIVDRDDAWLAALAGQLAAVEGLVVAHAADAAAAVAQAETPDLVVWDIPCPDGFDVQANARILTRFPCADVVVAVGHARQDDVVRLLRAGVTYLCDPREEPETTALHVRQFLALRRRTAAESEGMQVEHYLHDWVEITAPSQEKCVESLARWIQALAPSSIDARRRRALGYVLREIGQNAVEWGNAFDAGKRLRVSFCVLEDRVLLKIEDEGEGFDTSAALRPRGDALAMLLARRAAGRRTGGYGLAIVKGLVDAMVFNERGNAVVLTLCAERATAGVRS